jgi:hypothetical protein
MPIGMDTGTYNLVVCKRNKDNNFSYKKEVNAFIEIPISDNKFVLNMMKSSGVPLVIRDDAGVAYALGEKAVEIAYSMPQIDLRRPMKDGCLNPKERSAQQILSLMLHGLIENCEANETLYYSVPANAINETSDADYHSRVLESMFRAFKDDNGNKIDAHPINEALALVYAELGNKAYTGIGVSCGAGMVNVCFAKFGAPMFQFSIINSGDWIDQMSARATGESPTFINKEKTKLDLTQEPEGLVLRAIKAQYEIMVQKTVTQIKKGIEEMGNKARAEHPIDIVVSGGTASPAGFEQLFKKTFDAAKVPVQVGEVIKPKDNLLSVARGCLLAAENAGK